METLLVFKPKEEILGKQAIWYPMTTPTQVGVNSSTDDPATYWSDFFNWAQTNFTYSLAALKWSWTTTSVQSAIVTNGVTESEMELIRSLTQYGKRRKTQRKLKNSKVAREMVQEFERVREEVARTLAHDWESIKAEMESEEE